MTSVLSGLGMLYKLRMISTEPRYLIPLNVEVSSVEKSAIQKEEKKKISFIASEFDLNKWLVSLAKESVFLSVDKQFAEIGKTGNKV